jgi:hypothetical protein
MILDLRIPMGLMFTLVGAILSLFGMSTKGSPIYDVIGGLNVNLWWGLVLLVFGMTMYILGRRGQRKLASLPPEPVDKAHSRHGH